jgi:hypothetical protein
LFKPSQVEPELEAAMGRALKADGLVDLLEKAPLSVVGRDGNPRKRKNWMSRRLQMKLPSLTKTTAGIERAESVPRNALLGMLKSPLSPTCAIVAIDLIIESCDPNC